MSDAAVTWVGHATALVELAGERVLIDPLGRRRCRGLAPTAILITHAHVDHLNRWTLAVLDRGAALYVPKGAGRYVADLGFRTVREVEPGDAFAVGHLDVVAVPTRHDPGRWRKGDAPICTGYVVTGAGHAVHHSGDVDMSDFDVFDAIGEQFDLDATLLPIGGILPVWYYRARRGAKDRGVHIDPDTALDLARRLRAKTFVPVHYGTVQIPFGPARTAPRRLARVARERNESERVRILGHGESMALARPRLLGAAGGRARAAE
ncbi:MAG: MBL fold metallo-hydrolase [Deltaproteobacteria bacterium]|nr:MAG: MBL fold metallo-hydrolase [Deltaproteobacteria bacterium]